MLTDKRKISKRVDALLKENLLEEAIEFIVNSFESLGEEDKCDEVILLSSRLKELNQKETGGRISILEEQVERNKIRKAISEYKKSLCKTIEKRRVQIVKSRLPKLILAGLIFISLCIITKELLSIQNPQVTVVGDHDHTDSHYKEINGIIQYPIIPDSIIEDFNYYFPDNQEIEGDSKLERNVINSLRIESEQEIRGRHMFPTFDFRFYNQENKKLDLTRFWIDIENYQLDISPILKFNYYIKSENRNELVINVDNIGWGDALQCECSLIEDSTNISKLFSNGNKRFAFSKIAFRNNSRIIRLQLKDSELRKIFRKRRDERQSVTKDNTKLRYVKLGKPRFRCKYLDENNREQYKHFSLDQALFLSKKGIFKKVEIENSAQFQKMHNPATDIEFHSENLHTVILDPNIDKRSSNYTLKYGIAPKGIANFHILVGCKRSCKMKIKFYFEFSNGMVKSSKEFNIEIYSPASLNLDKYENGKIVKRASTHPA